MPDTTPPNVTTLIPISNSFFNITNAIEIAANATNTTLDLSTVWANISYPNGSAIPFQLDYAQANDGNVGR